MSVCVICRTWFLKLAGLPYINYLEVIVFYCLKIKMYLII